MSFGKSLYGQKIKVMKANAPENKNMYIPQKIYLPYKDGKVIGLVKETGVPFKSGVDGNIEYTRTDALPHWKKSALPNDNVNGFNSDYFCHKGYCINYKELFEKLPKDV